MSETVFELIPLDWYNLARAQRLGTRIFPREASAIFRSLVGSLLPRRLQPLCCDKAIADATYNVAILSGHKHRAAGLTGLYTLRDRPSEAWLGWYGVDACWRGCGLGRAILAATIDQARSQGYRTLRLWTIAGSTRTAAAIRLYRTTGFTSQSTGYVYHGYPVEIYSLALTANDSLRNAGTIPAVLAGANPRELARC
jgi:GNAT superfamily N-acetyltransferase